VCEGGGRRWLYRSSSKGYSVCGGGGGGGGAIATKKAKKSQSNFKINAPPQC